MTTTSTRCSNPPRTGSKPRPGQGAIPQDAQQATAQQEEDAVTPAQPFPARDQMERVPTRGPGRAWAPPGRPRTAAPAQSAPSTATSAALPAAALAYSADPQAIWRANESGVQAQVAVNNVRLGSSGHVTVGHCRAALGADQQELSCTAVDIESGSDQLVDVGVKVFDASAKHVSTPHRSAHAAAASLLEGRVAMGRRGADSAADFRQELRYGAGVGAGVELKVHDPDGDGVPDYSAAIDGIVGLGATYETETPLRDGAAAALLFTPGAGLYGAVYLTARALGAGRK